MRVITNAMDAVNLARLEEVLKRARSTGYDKDQAFDEFRAVLIEWVAGEPLGLPMDGDVAWMLCEIWMDPKEGLIKGGDGYEHLDLDMCLNDETVNQFKFKNVSSKFPIHCFCF